MPRARRAALAGVLVAVSLTLAASSSQGDLQSRYQSNQQKASALQSRISAESTKIQGFEGSISSLQARLDAIEQSLVVQDRLLNRAKIELTLSRNRLQTLEGQYAHDRQMLAQQLVADYESPQPSIVNVILESTGFQDLLNKINNLRAVSRANATVVKRVNADRLAVTEETRQLQTVELRRERTTAAVVVERDDVAQYKLSIVDRELVYAHARDRHTTELTSLKKTLQHESSVLNAEAAKAEAASAGTGAPPAGGCINTPFVAHGGEFGFFQAPGTNYSVNEEPVIAARLDALGKALNLHLIGISGYRSPEHSVEVGGFADDPHTRGEASDTPGVEGVSESTLAEFCLERPFPGPAEADHIQELGSPL
jgi:peptidoglycan hydrolase CwlO-like protein